MTRIFASQPDFQNYAIFSKTWFDPLFLVAVVTLAANYKNWYSFIMEPTQESSQQPQYSQQTQQTQQTQPHLAPLMEVPDWLMVEQSQEQRSTRELRELADVTYLSFFETVLERVANGETLTMIVKEDGRAIDPGKFRQWMHKDSERSARYYEARAIGAEAVEDQLIDISDAVQSLEDVQRSTLKISTRKWLMGVWDRKRYAETKQVQVTTAPPSPDRLKQLEGRLLLLQRGQQGVYDVQDTSDISDVIDTE